MFYWLNDKISRFLRVRPQRYGLFSFILLCVIIFLLVEGFIIVEQRLRPAILSIAEIKADVLATETVNEAIRKEIAGGVHYRDLISITQDENGRIVMAQLNTIKVNRLMADTTIAAQEALVAMGEEPFKIPVGEILGSYLLAAYGPELSVRLIPAGRVNTYLVDSFEDAGINQVRHKIYMDVVTEVRVVIPFISSYVEVHTTVPIADAVYAGDVPETVVNLNLGPLQ